MTTTRNRPTHTPESPGVINPREVIKDQKENITRLRMWVAGLALTTVLAGGYAVKEANESPRFPTDRISVMFGGNDGLGGEINNGTEAARSVLGTPNEEGGYDYPDWVDGKTITDLARDINRLAAPGPDPIQIGRQVEVVLFDDNSWHVQELTETVPSD